MRDQIAQVRRFNRVVTQRVGALQDHYLARERPLGEARLLWEIGPDGREVRALRHDLELDSGYVSRLLRSLERDGLVRLGSASSDRRVREARLTRAGRAERAVLDRRSDELAAALLEHLDDHHRDRLVTAMAEVERLLTAATVRVEPTDPEHPAALHCLGAYAAELDTRFEGGFDTARSIALDPAEMRPPAGVLLVATLGSDPVGCVGLRLHPGAPAEVKRMWVDPSTRGLGLGRRLLQAVETWAARHGARRLRLETNRSLVEAIALYRAAGYREVAAFNSETYADHWFEKAVPRAAADVTRGD